MFAIKGAHVNKYHNPKVAVEVFCSYLVTPNAAGYELGTEFFAMPTYSEMDALFTEHVKTTIAA